MPPARRILLADDHPVVLDALRRLLERDTSLEVVGEAARADTAISEAAVLRPDVLLLDYCLPGPPAAEVVRQVAERSPRTRVLVFTGYPDAACLREVREAGAAGYVAMNEPLETFLRSVQLVASGGQWFPKVLHEAPPPAGAPCPAFTAQEAEVLRLLVAGLTDREIADEVCLSQRRVRQVSGSVYRKLGVDRRVRAVVRALDLGLVDRERGIGFGRDCRKR